MNVRKIICVLFLLAAVACNTDSKKEVAPEFLDVIKVVDGDTFWVLDKAGQKQKIRLIGVDTPETVHPRKPVEYYGKEASNFAKKLLKGNQVRLEYDVAATDRYGRLLAYVYLKDGTFFNAKLVEEGYAHAMTVPPNVKYADEFKELERKARKGKKGLWKKKRK